MKPSEIKAKIATANKDYLEHMEDWGEPPHDCDCPFCLSNCLALELEKAHRRIDQYYVTCSEVGLAREENAALHKQVEELEREMKR